MRSRASVKLRAPDRGGDDFANYLKDASNPAIEVSLRARGSGQEQAKEESWSHRFRL